MTIQALVYPSFYFSFPYLLKVDSKAADAQQMTVGTRSCRPNSFYLYPKLQKFYIPALISRSCLILFLARHFDRSELIKSQIDKNGLDKYLNYIHNER